jgi:two-component system response regulator AtoC
LCAQAIFEISGRAPFLPVNCAAIPEALAESELFGHEHGAFTGAVSTRIGVVEQADGGTLFLDELAELPCPIQAKLLRTLESGEYRRLGGRDVRYSSFRIIAATSGDLAGAIAAGRLREDLLHRVSAVRIRLPPLRERLEDLPALAQALLRRYRERAESGPRRLASGACAMLMGHCWPGNIRELRNVVEASAAASGTADEVDAAAVRECLAMMGAASDAPEEDLSLAQVRHAAEGQAILEALARVGGNRLRAARSLGISQATLYRRLAALSSRQRRPRGELTPA